MVAFVWMLYWMKVSTTNTFVFPRCSSPPGCRVEREQRKGMNTVTRGPHVVSLAPLCQVMKPVAQAVEAAVQMTSVPPSLISSPPKHHRLTPTGGRWRLQPRSLAGHCRHCSSSSSVSYCRDSGDNPRSGRRNCVLATEAANFPLFLYSWTMDHATNTCSFLWEESSTATCFPFLFSQRVPGARLNCFLLFSDMSEDDIHSWENSFSNLYYRRLSELHFLLCCKSKKGSYSVCFSLTRKKRGEETKKTVFFLNQASLKAAAFQQNINETKKDKKGSQNMQPFFTDSQVSLRNFSRMIQVISMIIAIGRKSGFFFQHKRMSQRWMSCTPSANHIILVWR